MAVLKPFRAVRPAPEKASAVAALPYDVMSSREAREMAADNPWSFLHVDKAEIDLPPETGLYDDIVYETAAANLKKLLAEGVMERDAKPCYYLYKEVMGERSQTGIVGCASIDDYLDGTIKKHELTVEAKERDRIRHVDACDANTGVIFLTFRSDEGIGAQMSAVMESSAPVYDFVSEDDVRHMVWVISDEGTVGALEAAFAAVPAFYIADGHHRAASAVRVGVKRREAKADYDGSEEFNYFLAAAFPASELSIWDYNRVVKDLNGLTEDEFLAKLKESFDVLPLGNPMGASENLSGAAGKALTADAKSPEAALQAVRSPRRHAFSMYLGGKWYCLAVKAGSVDESDPVGRLDVSILQERVLGPILGIDNPRTDSRISFIGGIRGLRELVKLVDDGAAAAFAMYPTTMDELMSIADAGRTMPPKSTWFEPKLRSGLFIHELS